MALALTINTNPTRASEPEQDATPVAARIHAHRLKWDFPRFREWQYALTITATGYFVYSELHGRRSADTGWRDGVLFDDPARDTLRANGRDGRRRADKRSDLLWYSTEFYTTVVDGIIVPLFFDDFNVDVALQLTLLNLQGLSVTAALTRLTQEYVGRHRPALRECKRDPYYEFCQDESTAPTSSFLSGHVSTAFFGASAACAHHQALPLYGHSVADWGTCALLMSAATTNGILRIVSDAHWATDVVAGALLGLGSGYGLAYGLHYANPSAKDNQVMFLPATLDGKPGLELRAVW